MVVSDGESQQQQQQQQQQQDNITSNRATRHATSAPYGWMDCNVSSVINLLSKKKITDPIPLLTLIIIFIFIFIFIFLPTPLSTGLHSSLSLSLSLSLASMDVSFSAKPKTIISCHPLSTTSSSPSSFSSQFCIFRKEFFGSRHRLRPPELHSRRRKFKKLGFQIQPPPRFLFRASLVSPPIVVIVAVAAAFSALTVIYFEYNRRRRNKAFKDLSGHKKEDPGSLGILEPSKQQEVGVFRKQGIENHILEDLEIIDGETETPMKQSKLTLTEKINQNGNGHVSEETILVVQQQQQQQHHKAKASEPPVFVDVSMEQAAAVDPLAFPPVGKISQLVLEPVISTKERNDLPSKGHQAEEVTYPELCRQTVETNSATSTTTTAPVEHSHASEIQQETSSPDLCQQMVEPISTTFIASVEHAHAEIQQAHKPKHETGETVEIHVSGHNGLSTESVREELYRLHNENQSGVVSISNFPEAGSNGFSSLLRPTMTTRAEVSTQGSHTTTEYLEQEMPLASNGRGSSHKRKNIGKEVGFPRDVGKSLPPQNGQRGQRIFPQPNGVQVNGERDPSEYLSTYNRWVRNGRLSDCVKLLQSVERLGLLDMDKIYHSRFFNTCKSQKAVKEAFSFTKLIRNPTLSTFNMLLSVCASSQDSEGAFQVLKFVKEAGLKADCKLYTTLISTCAKSGKVDAMFEVFHQMVNAGVKPNVNTYGALIDGCARAGQVAKAFGAYGILRSKNVKPDRVVFNALITACGQSGAVDRAFDVLAEMGSELPPINPDHVTIGALIKTCAQAGQFDRAHEVYKMIHQYNIKGTPEVYTIAVNSCSQMGDLDFALIVYDDMKKNEVVPDEMCLSTLINVAGRAGKIDVAFKILQEARVRGTKLGNVSYSSLMGACSNAKDWQMALKLYEDIKSIKLRPTVSTLNALITALCDGDQLQKATEVLDDLKKVGVRPNIITYSVLLVACEKKDELELGALLHSQAKKDGVVPNLTMCGCLIGMCLRRFRKAYKLGEPTLSFNSGKPQIDNKWTSLALTVYREMIISGVVPTIDIFSQVLGCLQFPHDTSLKIRLVENLGVSIDASKSPNLTSLIDGFGEYDPCSFSLLEEAGSLGVLPCVSFKKNPIVVDARQLPIHTAEVYILTILKGLKHRLAAGAKLPNVNILLSVEKAQALTPKGEKTFNIVGRIGIAVGALLRRMGLYYQGNESYGKVRISGLAIKRWLQPKLESPFSGKPAEFNTSETRLGKAIIDQQRNIRTFDLSLE